MAITVTSKYKPFTYEELVKPLEGYWKEYDENEEALAKLKTDASSLKTYLDSLPKVTNANGELVYSEADQKLINQYNNYLNSLDKLSTDLASSGLTYDIKSKIKDLPTVYNGQIAPIATAVDRRIKFLDTLNAQEAQGNWLSIDPNQLDLASFISGPLPKYYSLNSQQFGNLVTNSATAATQNMSLVQRDKKWTVGIKPQNYINGKLTAAEKAITDKLEEDALNQILESLHMTKEQYNNHFSESRRQAIDSLIKDRIADGLRYNETPITDRQSNSKPVGYSAFIFPRMERQLSDSQNNLYSMDMPDKTAYDEVYNDHAKEFFKDWKHKDKDNYAVTVADSKVSGQPAEKNKINLFSTYNNTQQAYIGNIWYMPVYAYNKKDPDKKIQIGSIPISRKQPDIQEGTEFGSGPRLTRGAKQTIANSGMIPSVGKGEDGKIYYKVGNEWLKDEQGNYVEVQ